MLEQVYISEAMVSTSFGWKEIVTEDANGNKRTQIALEGEFQRANSPNKNKRVYKPELLSRETKKLAQIIEDRRGLPMEMDHPLPGADQRDMALAQRVSMDNACALCTHLEMSGDVVYGKATILEGDHGSGDKLAAMVRAGYKPGVSSRGLGGKPMVNEQGYMVVPEDYNMVTYDFVTNPSTYNAVLEHIVESEMLSFNPKKDSKKLWQVLIDLENKYK